MTIYEIWFETAEVRKGLMRRKKKMTEERCLVVVKFIRAFVAM
jgi:hypothetical protein